MRTMLIVILIIALVGCSKGVSEVQTPIFDSTHAKCLVKCEDDFYYRSSLIEGTMDECNLIVDGGLRDTCMDEYYYSIASNDANNCEKIRDENKRSDCLNTYFFPKAVKTNDIEQCERLSLERREGCRNTINLNLALKNLNTEYCDKMTSGQESCKNRINIKKDITGRDFSLCMDSECDDRKLTKYALALNDVSICDSLLRDKESCLDLVYHSKGECDKIVDKVLKESCN